MLSVAWVYHSAVFPFQFPEKSVALHPYAWFPNWLWPMPAALKQELLRKGVSELSQKLNCARNH